MKKSILSKNNMNTKIISVIASAVLWMYVIAVVDPEEKKVIENIPITITNSSDIIREGLVIYPNENLKTDITIEGKLSEIQKLNKNNINIYGDIVNPVEGKNIVNLRTNISNRVSRELKDTNFVVNLEKSITKKVNVKIDVPIAIKNQISQIIPEEDAIEISGPKELVNKVDYVGGTISQENIGEEDISIIDFLLVAYTENGVPVNVDISKKKIKVKVMYIVSKEVPIRINYLGNKYDISNFTINPDKVTLLGNNETLKKIDKISTVELKDEDLEFNDTKKIKIELPYNIKLKDEISQIELIKNK